MSLPLLEPSISAASEKWIVNGPLESFYLTESETMRLPASQLVAYERARSKLVQANETIFSAVKGGNLFTVKKVVEDRKADLDFETSLLMRSKEYNLAEVKDLVLLGGFSVLFFCLYSLSELLLSIVFSLLLL